ncbi:MAG: organomercurial lyase [Acidimicrobiales bacterium]
MSNTGHMDQWQLRGEVYGFFSSAGRGPTRAEIEGWVGDPELAAELLADLHRDHALVLDDAGEVRMALPFSAVETDHRVVSGDRSWWANCAWDALAVPITLGIDAQIDARWTDTGEPVGLSIVDGQLSETGGYVHFAVPARRWWDDIVET